LAKSLCTSLRRLEFAGSANVEIKALKLSSTFPSSPALPLEVLSSTGGTGILGVPKGFGFRPDDTAVS